MLAEHKKLRSSHTSKVCQALLTVIGDKSKPIEVRRRALEAVAPLGLPQVKEAIMEAYQSHSFRLRISSIYAMGKNCDHSWLLILLKELANAEAEIRYEAVGACSELEEEEAIPYLVELIDDPDADAQMAAIQALGKIGGSEAKKCLEQCLDNPSEVVQRAVEQALDELEATEDPFSLRI